MTLKLLFTINAVAASLFGLGFLLVPAPLLALYGLSPDPNLIYLARLLGGAVLGYGIVTWMARPADASPARRAIVFGYFVGFAASLVAALMGQLAGVVNAWGWSTVALYVLFTLGYGYFHFVKPTST